MRQFADVPAGPENRTGQSCRFSRKNGSQENNAYNECKCQSVDSVHRWILYRNTTHRRVVRIEVMSKLELV